MEINGSHLIYECNGNKNKHGNERKLCCLISKIYNKRQGCDGKCRQMQGKLENKYNNILCEIFYVVTIVILGKSENIKKSGTIQSQCESLSLVFLGRTQSR